MSHKNRAATDLVPHLRQCGYGEGQLALPFEFDDVSIPLVAFAGKPWDSWSACIAAVDVVADSRSSAAQVSTLGVPTVFACHGKGVDWWAMGPEGPQGEPRSIAWTKIGAAFAQERESLHPSRIYASKLRKPDSHGEQLWFFDAGLMPAVERKRGEALTRLVEEVINGLRSELGARLNYRQAQEDVYRTVFWLLAAKILHDKRVPNFIRIDLGNVDDVFDRIGKHHGETERYPPFGKTGRPAIDAAAERIAGCGSLADVSSESLAHVYENALIDKAAGKSRGKGGSCDYDIRKELGIHSTPSVLISHMLSQLWPLIEEIEPNDRHVFEPACGHVPFLTASMRWLRDLGDADSPENSHEYLRSHLHGLEADSFALEVAKLALTLGDEPHGNKWALTEGDMFELDVLASHARKAHILLANPPYEPFNDADRRKYKNSGAEITSKTKAVEMLKRTLPALPSGGVFGLVVPRGVQSNNESRTIRKFLLQECELTEIDVFADNLFEHGDHEVIVLLGRKKKAEAKPGVCWYRQVREKEMDSFKERLAFSWERQVPQCRFANDEGAELHVPELDEVWTYLSGSPTLEQFASMGKGIDFKGKSLPKGCWTVRAKAAQTGVLGFANVAADLRIYDLPTVVRLNLAPRAVLSYRHGKPTGKPQVLLNYAPVSRKEWRLKATLDEFGHALTSRLSAIRPKTGGPSALLLWAIMNSPVANAFAFDHLGKRDILVGTMRKMPLPTYWERCATQIEQAALRYRAMVVGDGPLFNNSAAPEAIRQALLEMDAAVLRAYDLPPRVERQLLDLFTGAQRKGVGCDFRGYYPSGLDAYVPLHELISEEYQRSTSGELAKRFEPVRSKAALAALDLAEELAAGD